MSLGEGVDENHKKKKAVKKDVIFHINDHG